MKRNYFDSHYFQFDKIKNHLDSLDSIPQKISYLEWLKIETKAIYTCYNEKYEVKESDFQNHYEFQKHIKIIQKQISSSVKEKIRGNIIYSYHCKDISFDIKSSLDGNEILKISCSIISLDPLIIFIDEKIEFWKNQLIFENQYSIKSKTVFDSETKSNPKVTKAKNRIEWKLKHTDLIDFLKLMKHYNLISVKTYKDMNVVIRDCFIDENGNDFDNQQIAKTKFNKTKDSKNFHKSEKLMQDFNTNKSKNIDTL